MSSTQQVKRPPSSPPARGSETPANKPLFSPHWHRVANLRPRVRSHVDLVRHFQRSTPWYVLIDRAGERMQRLNRPAFEFVGRCDGQLTVEQIWSDLMTLAPEQAMTQNEVVELLMLLHERGGLQFDVTPDVESIFRLHQSKEQRQRQSGVNPLAFRIGLMNPTALLKRLEKLGQWLFSSYAAVAWLALIAWAAFNAAPRAAELAAHFQATLDSPRGIFTGWLLYPLVKGIHELAHGLAIRRFGGEVRQAGLMVMMLTPIPFVNASAADAFRDRHQRIIVSAAGIMAELAIASIGFFIWQQTQAGIIHDLALAVMFIGSVSTVFINGNPLMRFDGYFVMCDALDLHNLSLRSTRFWIGRLKTRLMGQRNVFTLEPLPGETLWLTLYAPLAWAYRCGLSLGITLWIARHSAILGILVAISMLWSLFGQPLSHALRQLFNSFRRDPDGHRLLTRAALIGIGTIGVLVGLPLPFNTIAEGVVWPSDQAQLRVGSEGFITEFPVADGSPVSAGQALIQMHDETLDAQLATAVSAAAQLESQLFQAMSESPDKVPDLNQKLEYAHAEVARLNEKIDKLIIRAQVNGILVLPHQLDLLGTYHKQGEMLGYLLTNEPTTVRVALLQQDATLVREEVRQVDVLLAESGGRSRTAHISLDIPAAVNELPSAALGDQGGGEIPTDMADKEGLKTRIGIVNLNLVVPGLHSTRIGGRVTVRFNHGYVPLLGQMVRRIQQLILHTFNPAT